MDYMNYRIPGAEYVQIDALRPYEHNAKEHPEWQVDQIVESIKTFGMRRRIGVWENPETHELTVTTGHGRLLACQRLGFAEVPIERDSDLNDSERRMWTHTDNQANANSGIDAEILGADLDEIGGDYDLEALGFEADTEASYDPLDLDGEKNAVKERKQIHCPKCGFKFEVDV